MTKNKSMYLLVGGSFDENGGRPSGYFKKLTSALAPLVDSADWRVINGGTYEQLKAELESLKLVTHLIWFADVPNTFPKLLPGLKSKYPRMVFVTSKNNRRGAYSREQLFERMAKHESQLLLEFTQTPEGVLLASLLKREGEVLLDHCADIPQVAQALAPALTEAEATVDWQKRVCVIGKSGPTSAALQYKLSAMSGVSVTVLSSQDMLALGDLSAVPEILHADLVILCVQDFVSPTLLEQLPPATRILDISPSFRTLEGWVYGLPELPGNVRAIELAQHVANPGCFATSAVLPLAPLSRAGLLTMHHLYLDAIGGYTTGGATFEARAAAGTLPAESVYSLQKEHRHVAEIKAHTGYSGHVWFSPKVGAFPRGIRMQIPLPALSREEVLQVLETAYAGSEVQVSRESPSKLSGDFWAGKAGACIHVIAQSGGCLVICHLDNLGKGAADSACTNTALMLGLSDAQKGNIHVEQ